jgi:nitrite reductase/ring-hydroxylating ferredoxin subunit
VKCPIHGSEFDLRTGKVVEEAWGGPKKTEDLRVYSVVRRATASWWTSSTTG